MADYTKIEAIGRELAKAVLDVIDANPDALDDRALHMAVDLATAYCNGVLGARMMLRKAESNQAAHDTRLKRDQLAHAQAVMAGAIACLREHAEGGAA